MDMNEGEGNAGGRGSAGQRGIKGGKWNNCNSIINKIYLKRRKQLKSIVFYFPKFQCRVRA